LIRTPWRSDLLRRGYWSDPERKSHGGSYFASERIV
jgi:hypothetical protein